MADKPYNKIAFDGDVLIDLTGDTVEAASMRSGVKAHDKSGTQIVGTMQDVEQASISMDLSEDGRTVTATAVQSAGYVSAGTKAIEYTYADADSTAY